MKSIFVDSGGFFALLVPEDVSHIHAKELFQQANNERWRLVTTNIVVIEAYTLLLTRTREGRSKAMEFLDRLTRTEWHVERIRKIDEERAMDLLRTQQDKAYSFCDALSFVVMERLHIKAAISFDRHFRDYGHFTIL